MPKVEMDEHGELRWVSDEVVRDGQSVRVPLQFMDSEEAKAAARRAYADKCRALDATMTRHLRLDSRTELDNQYDPARDYAADAARAFDDRMAALNATMLRGRR